MKRENFIKKIDEMKKANKLDLSVGEDLSIGLMNLISLEEHFLFSYMKTENKKYLEFLEQTREVRKRLLAKIVKKDKGDYSEKWCISKHLLAATIRLTEVGTKYLHEGKKKDAEEIFIDAFNIYSMFWAMNGFSDLDKIGKGNISPGNFLSFNSKMEKPTKGKLSGLSNMMKKMLDCCRE